jgi:hypothetical protein
MMHATLTNMRAMQAQGAEYTGPTRLVALNRATGEEYSANPGDYWNLEPDDCLKGARGRKLVLAYRKPATYTLA